MTYCVILRRRQLRSTKVEYEELVVYCVVGFALLTEGRPKDGDLSSLDETDMTEAKANDVC